MLHFLLAILLLATSSTGLFAAPDEHFEMHVRPVLAKQCYSCHSTTKMAGLALNSREAMLQGGNSGPAVVPGKPDESLLLQVVRHSHAKVKMPPGGKLADSEIEAITAWIGSGAPWPQVAAAPAVPAAMRSEFWSFQPVKKLAPPAVKQARWVRSPIDAFILARLEQAGLQPAQPADKRTLLRRVTFDLTGLPPTPAEMQAFVSDNSPQAFATVVDRLLASPHYGERWGRHWMDVVRYSDDKMESQFENPHPNAFRYRDWIISALNSDLPYDQFVKAQLAGDLIDAKRFAAATGFHALRPEQQDDRVDATTRGLMGLTVACAQCHDHKFDPIPQADYYALQGIFDNSEPMPLPLVVAEEAKQWDQQKERLEAKQEELRNFQDRQAVELAGILAARTVEYLMAAADHEPDDHLDLRLLQRWRKYLAMTDEQRGHTLLKPFLDNPSSEQAAKFEQLLLTVYNEKKDVEQQNLIRLGGSKKRGDLSQADLVSLPRDKFVVWRQMFGPRDGILYLRGAELQQALGSPYQQHMVRLEAEVKAQKAALPKQYAFLHALRDVAEPKNGHILIRGQKDNPGAEVSRHFLSVLSPQGPQAYTKGSGRLQLAEAVVSPTNPLTPRVMVNRIWMHHFGAGLVRTPGNFGQLGERPTHPELLDHLAARFVELGWSMKKMHREILLSSVYQIGWRHDAAYEEKDPDNKLLWRANRRRLEAESLRDAMLAVSGKLDATVGGPAIKLTEDKNTRRTVYGFRSRRKLDSMLSLFDHPVPVAISEQRLSTNVPLQRLYLLNNAFVLQQAEALSANLQGDLAQRIQQAYQRCYGRAATPQEVALGEQFLQAGNDWPQYAQVLLTSNEFLFVN